MPSKIETLQPHAVQVIYCIDHSQVCMVSELERISSPSSQYLETTLQPNFSLSERLMVRLEKVDCFCRDKGN